MAPAYRRNTAKQHIERYFTCVGETLCAAITQQDPWRYVDADLADVVFYCAFKLVEKKNQRLIYGD